MALGALLGMPSSASAAGWLPSVPLPGAGSEPKVAADASGDVVAAWKGPGNIVQASIRPAGGAFSPPVTVTPAGRAASSLDLDVNDAGAGVLAWTASTGGVPVVQFVDVSPGGAGPVQTVPAALAGPEPDDVSVAVDRAGTATLAWTFSDSLGTSDPEDDRPRVRLGRRPAGGTVTVTGPLSATTETATAPAVAVNAAGLASAAWTVDQLNASGDLVGAAVRSVTWPSGGAPGSVETARTVTGEASTFSEARVAVDGPGSTLVAWIATESRRPEDRELLQTAVRPAQGAYGASVTVSGPAENVSGLALDVNEAGTAALAYSVSAVADNLRIVGRSAGGQFTGPGQTVAIGLAVEELVGPTAAINVAGTAFVGWVRGTTTTSAVEAAVGPPNALGALTKLSPPAGKAQTPAISADGEGNAFMAWDANGPLGATAFDGAPPKLNGLAVPATAVVEEPAGFSVAPFDTWSAVTSTWGFGDGTGAVGNVVSHAFGSPGSYTVGLTATDAAGNASSDTRTLTVTPKATAPPPPAPPRAGLSLTGVAGSRYCLAVSGRAKDLVLRFTLNDPATVTFRLQKRSQPRAKARRRCPSRGGAPGATAVQFDDVQTATLPASAGETFTDVKTLGGAGRKASATGSRRTSTRAMRLPAGPARARLAQLFGSKPLPPGWYRILLQGRRGDDGSTSQAVSVKFLVLDERR